jgi:hypothetical protein
MAATIEKRRTVHGGPDSALSVEVSPVRKCADGFETCAHEPESATRFGVYIRNPLALHVRDFVTPSRNGNATSQRLQLDRLQAYGEAITFASALADHLGCGVHVPGGFA